MPWRQLRLGCHPPGLFDRLKALPGFNPRELLEHGARDQGDRGLPRGRVRRLGRAPHRARAALVRGRPLPACRRSPRTSSASCSTASTSCSTSAGASSTRPAGPARPSRVGAGDDRALRALLPHARRDHRRARRRSPARTRRSSSPPTTASGPRATSSTSTRGSSSEGYLAWADGQRRRGRPTATAGRLRRSHPPRPRARLGAARSPTRRRRAARASTSSAGCPAATSRCPRTRAAADRGRAAPTRCEPLRRPHDGAAARRRGVDARAGLRRARTRQLGPDLSMVLADGGTMSILPSETLVARRPSRAATTAGRASSSRADPASATARSVDELSIVDVAPLILHRLGLPVPDDMAGRLPGRASSSPRSWSGRPPRCQRRARATESDPEPADVELDPDEQAAVLAAPARTRVRGMTAHHQEPACRRSS